MKMIMKSVLVVGVAGLAATTMFAQSSTTAEIVQYSAKVTMSNTGNDPDTTGASGTVQASESTNDNSKKNTDRETLNITAKGLDVSTDYSINATVSGSPTLVGPVTTDSKGDLSAMFSTSGNSKKNLGAPPTPLTSVSEVDVINSNSVTVLVADMTAPSSLKYTVRKNVTDNSGASAGVTVSSSTKRALLGINASGLNGGSDYVVRLNGGVVETNTASSKGTLKVINPLTTTNPVVTPFLLQSVELDETNGTPAISTSIP